MMKHIDSIVPIQLLQITTIRPANLYNKVLLMYEPQVHY